MPCTALFCQMSLALIFSVFVGRNMIWWCTFCVCTVLFVFNPLAALSLRSFIYVAYFYVFSFWLHHCCLSLSTLVYCKLKMNEAYIKKTKLAPLESLHQRVACSPVSFFQWRFFGARYPLCTDQRTAAILQSNKYLGAVFHFWHWPFIACVICLKKKNAAFSTERAKQWSKYGMYLCASCT